MTVTPVRAGVLIAGLVLACHAILPFTDYISFDDRYMVNWVCRGDLDYLYTFYSMVGGQMGYVYFSAFSGLGPLVPVFKTAGLVFAFLTGCLIWRIGLVSGFLTGAEALLVAAVAVALPAYKMKGGFVYSVYDGAPVVFLFGVLLALRAEERSGWGHAGRRAAALLLFAISFQMMSLLMFYGGFFLLLVLAHSRKTGRPWYHFPVTFSLRRFDYLALPFVYWVAKNALLPPQGEYVDYNRVGPTWERVKETGLAIPAVVVDPVEVTAGLSVPVLFGLIAAGLAAWAVVARILRPRPGEVFERAYGPTTGPPGLVAFGALLMVLGTFPYAAVGKAPGAWGATSSYAPLIPLPFAVLVLGVVKAVARITPREAAIAIPPALTLFGVCCAAGWWHNYLSMQAVEVRNRAVIQHLQALPQARDCTLYCFANQYPIPRTPDSLYGWEWVYTEAQERGSPRSFAFNGIPTTPTTPDWFVRRCMDETSLGFALTGVNEKGGQGVVSVRPGTEYSPPRVGWKYLWTKYTRPDRMGRLLDQVVRIEFYPAPYDPVEVKKRIGWPPG